ncbi:MAG: bifunctional (p)ppGpp synthetase/guanosine-3',5'-bis(diphosphate) 3'-pyrophosphohydrolase, partial [Chloroflexi bacterium]|nr:bifunctional (p)ppGpp synthetase/guanosine-3',5'-bis(diphosphate) 3'-pyrophosphohydrolase [Chloroflexota bacterium]
ADEEFVRKAYAFSMDAHGTQIRESGDPYFSHPVEVANIVHRMNLDNATVITALLHDTVEDTLATLDQIEDAFGPEIARLVDGVTKLSLLELSSDKTRQAENFRKLLLAMSADLRVLLVKLADRLHNMQTLSFVRDSEKRRRVALETMEIYAPLAERIGMQDMKEELEDLAFGELNPEARNSVIARLEFLRERGSDLIVRITDQLEQMLDAWVSGREQRPYSIWRKMERKNVSFEQLADVMAFRVVLDTVPQCYAALGTIHRAYPMVPNRFKDYISTPKRNNYRSLHTAVIGPEQQRIELQIRTWEMHHEAELGVAAHWQYKQPAAPSDGSQYRWLRELLEILEQTANPEEFLEHTKLEMFQDQVFCFSPRGDLIALPRGATPVDFAYAVHTDVGDSCVGAKINGRIAPLGTPLENGDQVEILRSRARKPVPAWENFVVTGKARAAIRRYVRQQKRGEYIDLGQAILEKAFREGGHEYSKKALVGALKVFMHKNADDLLAAVGEGVLTGQKVVEAIFPGEKKRRGAARRMLRFIRPRSRPRKAGDPSIPIRGLTPGVAVHYATCCHPLPGDRIVGIITTGKGVTIHTIDCESLENLADSPEQWLDVSWTHDSEEPELHVGRINAVVANEPGSLACLCTAIARDLGNISNLKIVNRSPDFFEMVVDIEVRDVKHLTDIIAALRASPQISSVKRIQD